MYTFFFNKVCAVELASLGSRIFIEKYDMYIKS